MAENGKIYSAIANVMADVGAVTKNKRNTQGVGFMYRGIDDVMNALNPAMAKHKIFVVPEILEQIREDRTTAKGYSIIYSLCKIKYTFFAEDGSNVSATVIGEAMDSGDKATNKSMSIAFKYACFQIFCIPTEEMLDPDSEVHDVSQKRSASNKKATSTQQQKTKSIEKPKDIQNQAEIANQPIGQAKIKLIKSELERTGVSENAILTRYKVAKVEEITEELFIRVASALKNTPTKEIK